MAYVPLNVNVYAAAFSGAVAGIGVPTGAFITDPVTGDYVTIVAVAAAYAEAVDVAWGAGAANVYDVAAITDGSTNIFTRGPGHPLVGAITTQANWTIVAMALVALVRQGDTNATTIQLINFPPLSILGGAPFPPIANLAALALFDVGTGVNQLPAGAEVYLLSLRCPLRLVKYAAAPPALIPFQTFAVLAGGVIDPLQQWLRLDCSATSNANPWLPQLAWAVAPAGNDEALGTPAAPLLTYVEFVRRMRGAQLDAIYSIQVLGDQVGMNQVVDLGPNGMLVIDGNPGAIPHPGVPPAPWPAAVNVAAIGGYTPINIVGQEWAIIDVDTPPGFDWTPYLNARVRCSPNPFPHAAGPLDRCQFHVAVVNPAGGGNNTARISIPNGFDPYDPLLPGLTGLVPQNGDFLLAEQLPNSGPVMLDVSKEAGPVLPSVNMVGFTFSLPAAAPVPIQIRSKVPLAVAAGAFGQPIIFGSVLNVSQLHDAINVWECGFLNPGGALQATGINRVNKYLDFVDCVFPAMVAQVANAHYMNCLWENSILALMPGFHDFIGSEGFFDAIGADAMVIAYPGVAVSSAGAMFGVLNGHALNVQTPGFSWVYQVAPTINAGGALEFRVMGVEYTWVANCPYPDAGLVYPATVEDVTIRPLTA